MSPILRLCVTITAFPEASYGQEQGSTSWFYLNSTITPLLVGDIYVCVFLNSLGGKHLGVTLWASRICPLHNFFLLGRSLRELVSLREGRNSCSPSPEGLLSSPEALCPSWHKACSGDLCPYFWTSDVFPNSAASGRNRHCPWSLI